MFPQLSSAASDGVLSVPAPQPVSVARGATAKVPIQVLLQPGYHINSHQPKDEYLIPLKLTWQPGALEVTETSYPEPEMETYGFSKAPLSVFTGDFEITVAVKAPSNAEKGEEALTGKLRYQACTDSMCLPPKSVPVAIRVRIE